MTNASGNRRSSHEVNGIDTLGRDMTDIWLNGQTIWIGYWLSDFIRPYNMSTRARKPGLDIQLARQNTGPIGIDSDGFQPLDAGPSQRHHLRVRRAPVGRTNQKATSMRGRA